MRLATLLVIVAVAARCGALEVLSLCGAGKCTMAIGNYSSPLCVMGNEPECGCVDSVRGTPCNECNRGAGYLTLDDTGTWVCSCYANDLDPNAIAAPCSPVVVVTEFVNTTSVKALVSCACHYSRDLGFFNISVTDHKYGQPSPGVCDRCAHRLLGAKPGQFLDSLLIPPQTCKVYGDSNPNRAAATRCDETNQCPTPDASWESCAGQGVWDAVAFRCNPNAGWKLRNTTEYFDGGHILIPDVCRVGSGPPTGAGFEPPFCTKVWAVNPKTGVEGECSEHGLMVDGVCACFSDDVNGHWALADVTIQSSKLVYTESTGSAAELAVDVVVVSTCARCVDGFTLADGCL